MTDFHVGIAIASATIAAALTGFFTLLVQQLTTYFAHRQKERRLSFVLLTRVVELNTIIEMAEEYIAADKTLGELGAKFNVFDKSARKLAIRAVLFDMAASLVFCNPPKIDIRQTISELKIRADGFPWIDYFDLPHEQQTLLPRPSLIQYTIFLGDLRSAANAFRFLFHALEGRAVATAKDLHVAWAALVTLKKTAIDLSNALKVDGSVTDSEAQSLRLHLRRRIRSIMVDVKFSEFVAGIKLGQLLFNFPTDGASTPPNPAEE